MFESLIQDVRIGLRVLIKEKSFCILAVTVLAGLYLWGQRRHPSDNVRRLAFDLGLILLLVFYLTPLETIALHYLLTIHLLQNVATAEWAPGLMVFGISPALALELTRCSALSGSTLPDTP